MTPTRPAGPEVAGPEVARPDAAGETGEAGRARSGNFVPETRVTAMFDAIAPVYDRMNTLMTAGLDGSWRRKAVKAAAISAGGSALDVACGTGKLTLDLASVAGPAGNVVGLDLAPAMLVEARKVSGDRPGVRFELGNALALPFPDGTFDAATIGFGMRNLQDYRGGFAEMTRVVRPGGRVVCLELSTPRPRWFGRAYLGIFRHFAPALGTLFRRRDAYAYLPQSLEGFPDPHEIAATMRRAGLVNVGFKRLAFGTVALHVGTVAPREGTAA